MDWKTMKRWQEGYMEVRHGTIVSGIFLIRHEASGEGMFPSLSPAWLTKSLPDQKLK